MLLLLQARHCNTISATLCHSMKEILCSHAADGSEDIIACVLLVVLGVVSMYGTPGESKAVCRVQNNDIMSCTSSFECLGVWDT